MPNPWRDTAATLDPDAARRLFLCAAATLAVHQAQEALVAREAIPIRTAALGALLAGSIAVTRLPPRAMGIVAVVMGAGPTFGAFAGHLVPLVRHGHATPASETALLNLGGGVLMLAVGLALLRRRAAD